MPRESEARAAPSIDGKWLKTRGEARHEPNARCAGARQRSLSDRRDHYPGGELVPWKRDVLHKSPANYVTHHVSRGLWMRDQEDRRWTGGDRRQRQVHVRGIELGEALVEDQ